MPVTRPAALTVAIAVLLLLQLPPVVTSLSVLLVPVHSVVVPVIATTLGVPFTVMVAVAMPVPQLPVTL